MGSSELALLQRRFFREASVAHGKVQGALASAGALLAWRMSGCRLPRLRQQMLACLVPELLAAMAIRTVADYDETPSLPSQSACVIFYFEMSLSVISLTYKQGSSAVVC